MTDSPLSEPLSGGVTNAGSIIRIGDTIRRPRSPGSEVVEALLLHLEKAGWPHSPRFLGVDDVQRQVLSYLPGQTLREPPWQTDDLDNAHHLGQIAGLLRSLHDTTVSFIPPPDAPPQRPLPVFGATWTHGDPGYPNIVYAEGDIAGFIDWEFAGPADPLCDLAALLAVSVRGPRLGSTDHERRVRAVHLASEAIATAYDLSDEQLARLPVTAALVLEDTAAYWTQTGHSISDIARLRWRADWFRSWSAS